MIIGMLKSKLFLVLEAKTTTTSNYKGIVMKNFMKVSTAIVFGLLVSGAAMFPVLVIAGLAAWFYIDQEYDDSNFNGFIFDEEEGE